MAEGTGSDAPSSTPETSSGKTPSGAFGSRPAQRAGALGPAGTTGKAGSAASRTVGALGSVGKGIGDVAQTAKSLTDSNTSGADKLAAGGQLAAQAIGTAVGSPVVGKVVSKVAGTKAGRGLMAAVGGLVAFILMTAIILIASVVQAATLAVTSVDDNKADTSSDGSCTVMTPVASLTPDQQANATAIVQTVNARRLPTSDAVIAIMTALTESGLRNVDHGDLAGPDSRGLFQQRDSWGSLQVRMDPAGATGLFLDRMTSPALLRYEGVGVSKTVSINASGADSRATFEPWRVAQSVQISAFPMGENYRAQYPQAVTIVSTMLGASAVDMTSVQHWLSDAGLTLPSDSTTNLPALAPSAAPTLAPAPSPTSDGSNCATPPSTGDTSPGQWGGQLNGQIPLEALCPLPWTVTDEPATSRYLRCDAVSALTQLNVAYRSQFGHDLSVNVAYRDLATQTDLYYHGGGTGPAAYPGTSNHGWGLAIDLNGTSGNGDSYEQRKTTVVYQWMAANAGAYGWRENVKIREAWHWEFWGTSTG